MPSLSQSTKTIRENIARAKNAMRRDEIVRALNVTADSLDMYSRIKVTGPIRFELEVNLDELMEDLSHHTSIQPILPRDSKGKSFVIRFKRGKESLLSGFLRHISTVLEKQKKDAAEEEGEKKERRKQELIEKGQGYLETGDIPRARTTLRRVADEFGKEEGIYLDLAERYRTAKLPMEAAEMYELNVNQFPKNPAGWSGMIDMYKDMQDFEMVEKLYHRVLQQFGSHPKTLCNIAKFYMLWRKKGKAAEYAVRALQADPNLTEAQTILDEAEGKKR